MNDGESLPYELVGIDTGIRVTAILGDDAIYIQDVPLILEEIAKVTIRYVENKGLVIIIIGRSIRSYGYYISPVALRNLATKVSSSSTEQPDSASN
jgi:hypothetical protein